MTSSFTISESTSFTLTHARHIGTKVAADLKRMQRFYGSPTDTRIAQFEAEIIELLRGGFLGFVMYGFKRDGNWIEPTVRYTARELAGMAANDDDPGRVRPSADITGASFYSFLTYNSAWNKLPQSEKDKFEAGLPFQRGGASEPGVSGYLLSDRTYSSGGRALDRASLRSY